MVPGGNSLTREIWDVANWLPMLWKFKKLTLIQTTKIVYFIEKPSLEKTSKSAVIVPVFGIYFWQKNSNSAVSQTQKMAILEMTLIKQRMFLVQVFKRGKSIVPLGLHSREKGKIKLLSNWLFSTPRVDPLTSILAALARSDQILITSWQPWIPWQDSY